MPVYQCPRCRAWTRIAANVLRQHTVAEPIKTWVRREDLDGAGVMVDIYPLCTLSNARVTFPDGAPPRKQHLASLPSATEGSE